MFGRVEVKKGEALSRVSYWDEKENDFMLIVEETEARNLAREDYKYWSLLEEVSWSRNPENSGSRRVTRIRVSSIG